MSTFVHLHVHTHYSLLDSTVKVKELVATTAERGMDAVAMTDHGNMFGAIEFQLAAGGSGVKPIFGVAVDVTEDRSAPETVTKPHQLVLLAERLEGYKNLVRLISEAWLNGVDRAGRPLVDYAALQRYADGVIALSGDIGGEVPHALLRGDRPRAVAAAERYREIFGRDNFFFEVQRVEGVPEFAEACDALVDLGAELDIPVVATNNVHYLHEGGFRSHAILLCIGLDKRISKDLIEKIPMRSLALKSPEEMEALFDDLPEAIANTRLIADRCDVTIPTGKNYLPAFEVPEGDDEPSFLRRVARAGLEDRIAQLKRTYGTLDEDVYRARLEVELDIIINMEFPGYFLIVWDFIKWAQEQGIPVGPGRGSGAGSIVAYALKITDIDPIKYGLLFERFLNPERVSMPDFDIDFCQNRRMEVIEYVTAKYGKNNVAMIVTFGQLKAKAAVRDVSRVMNLTYTDADRLAKLVPNALGIKLADAYDQEPRLRKEVAEDETIAFVYESALAVEGNNRNTGIHAAGVVISGDPLWEYVPIFTGTNGEYVSQYAKNEVEEAGLVKFDFLGLKTLTVIDDAVKLVNRQPGRKEPLDLANVPYDTPDVYEVIKSGDTTGVFQMESDGFQRLIRQLKPDCFEDLIAAVALYRPGPLNSGMVEQFIDCKHGRREVEYPHEWLRQVLAETYGVMVYQEQVMQCAQVLAGYSLGGADLLRRAMGKKKPAEMAKQREIFIEGAGRKGIPEDKANEIFDLMAHFSGYGFNKSHSAAYALIAFWTAYLKRYHAPEFYAALMTNDATSTEKVVKYIADARSRNIAVLPPDVGRSEHSFTIDDGAIRFGLGAVKGLGSGPIEAIAEARASGPFTSLFDFCERVDGRRCGKRVLEALIRCGAFDSSHPEYDGAAERSLRQVGRWRAQLFAVLEAAFERGQKTRSDRENGQSSLFDMFAAAAPVEALQEAYPAVRGWSEKQVLQFEKDTLGFYVSGHPLDRYREEVERFSDATSETIVGREHRAQVRMAGVVTGLRERPLKSGEGRMAFFQLEDVMGETEVVVYAKKYAELEAVLGSDDPILVTGVVRIDGDDDERVWKLMADSAEPLWQARTSAMRHIVLELDGHEVGQEVLEGLSALFEAHPGACQPLLSLNFGTAVAEVRLPESVRVSPTDELITEVVELLGEHRIRFR